MELVNLHSVVNSLTFAVIGVVVLAASFLLLDVMVKSYNLWKEIVEKQNQALAILLGAFTIALAIIIAAAIHG